MGEIIRFIKKNVVYKKWRLFIFSYIKYIIIFSVQPLTFKINKSVLLRKCFSLWFIITEGEFIKIEYMLENIISSFYGQNSCLKMTLKIFKLDFSEIADLPDRKRLIFHLEMGQWTMIPFCCHTFWKIWFWFPGVFPSRVTPQCFWY